MTPPCRPRGRVGFLTVDCDADHATQAGLVSDFVATKHQARHPPDLKYFWCSSLRLILQTQPWRLHPRPCHTSWLYRVRSWCVFCRSPGGRHSCYPQYRALWARSGGRPWLREGISRIRPRRARIGDRASRLWYTLRTATGKGRGRKARPFILHCSGLSFAAALHDGSTRRGRIRKTIADQTVRQPSAV